MSAVINNIYFFFFFFFFLRRYNFREVLAFSTSFFHLVWFLMQSFQFVIFILVISLSTSSSHLFLGLPSDLVSAGDHSYTFFTMLLSGIRCTCPNQANLCTLTQCKLIYLNTDAKKNQISQTPVITTSVYTKLCL